MSLLAGLSQQGDTISAHNDDPAAHLNTYSGLSTEQSFSRCAGLLETNPNDEISDTLLPWTGLTTSGYAYITTATGEYCQAIVSGDNTTSVLTTGANGSGCCLQPGATDFYEFKTTRPWQIHGTSLLALGLNPVGARIGWGKAANAPAGEWDVAGFGFDFGANFTVRGFAHNGTSIAYTPVIATGQATAFQWRITCHGAGVIGFKIGSRVEYLSIGDRTFNATTFTRRVELLNGAPGGYHRLACSSLRFVPTYRPRPAPALVRSTGVANALATKPALPYTYQPATDQLIGRNLSNYRLATSIDDGVTWVDASAESTGGSGTIGAWALEDGEVLVSFGGTEQVGGTLNRSSGWATNPATATFTQVLAANHPLAYFSGAWGVSASGNIVVACEYGAKLGPTNGMARHVYISDDYGRTWAPIFDLNAYRPAASGVHTHSAAYDPYWQCVWVTSGDDLANCAVWLCRNPFAASPSWTLAFSAHQFTSVVALRNCVLFGSDMGSAGSGDGTRSGVYRLDRGDPTLTPKLVYAWTTNNGLDLDGSQMFRMVRNGVESAVISCNRDNPSEVTLSPSVLITPDGFEFREVYSAAVTDITSGIGARYAVGPTASGKIVGWWSQDGTTNQMLTVSP